MTRPDAHRIHESHEITPEKAGADLRLFADQVDRIFQRWTVARPGLRSRVWPSFETYERAGRFVVRAELPGVRRDDVVVRVVGEALEIDGVRRDPREAEALEAGEPSSYGRIWRRIVLPEACEPERATAWFGNGVLEVVVPMRRAAPRDVMVRNDWTW